MTWEALHSAKCILYPSTVAKTTSKLETRNWDKVTKTMFCDLNYLIHFIHFICFSFICFQFALQYAKKQTQNTKNTNKNKQQPPPQTIKQEKTKKHKYTWSFILNTFACCLSRQRAKKTCTCLTPLSCPCRRVTWISATVLCRLGSTRKEKQMENSACLEEEIMAQSKALSSEEQCRS